MFETPLLSPLALPYPDPSHSDLQYVRYEVINRKRQRERERRNEQKKDKRKRNNPKERNTVPLKVPIKQSQRVGRVPEEQISSLQSPVSLSVSLDFLTLIHAEMLMFSSSYIRRYIVSV